MDYCHCFDRLRSIFAWGDRGRHRGGNALKHLRACAARGELSFVSLDEVTGIAEYGIDITERLAVVQFDTAAARLVPTAALPLAKRLNISTASGTDVESKFQHEFPQFRLR